MAFYKWPDGSVRATPPPATKPTGATNASASASGGPYTAAQNGANDQQFIADIVQGQNSPADLAGFYKNAQNAGMTPYEYWISTGGHNAPAPGSGSGGHNVFAGRAGEFMTNFGTPAPTYTPYNVAMPVYKPFTAADFQADPGYAFRQAEGKRAVEGSAAARGGFFSGQTGIDLGTMGQNIASQEWQNSYNRYQGDYQNKFQNWQTGYNVNMQDQSNALNSWQNQFNTWNTQQTNQFNRLADISGMGQTAANNLGNAGFNAANTAGNYMTNIGNAQATGINAVAGFNAAGNVNLGNQMMGYAGNAMYQPYISKMWGG